MHARMIRRHLSPRWRRISFIVVCLCLAQLVWLLAEGQVHAAMNVRYLQVEQQQSFASKRSYAGQTVAARSVDLAFQRGGAVDSIAVDLGDKVAAEQTLAGLDLASLQTRLSQANADISLARANLMALDAETQLAANTSARMQKLRKQGHVSQQAYDEARLALRAKQAQLNVARATLERAKAVQAAVQVDLDESSIKAPFAGVIQARYVDEGAQMAAGQAALRLVELDVVEAHVGVPAKVALDLQAGIAYPLNWAGETHEARLKAVLPELDANTRTLTAVLQIDDTQIPLGAVVELQVSQQISSAGFWLPLSALSASDRGLWGVFVIGDNNIVERRIVDIIHTEADRVYVRGTLAPADKVVATGVQRIVPGQQVKIDKQQATSYAR